MASAHNSPRKKKHSRSPSPSSRQEARGETDPTPPAASTGHAPVDTRRSRSRSPGTVRDRSLSPARTTVLPLIPVPAGPPSAPEKALAEPLKTTRRDVLERTASPPPPRRPGELRDGDVVTYDDGMMRGIVRDFNGKNVIIAPTHVFDDDGAFVPIKEDRLADFTDFGKPTIPWSQATVKLVTPTVEIKRIPPGGVDITHFHTGPITASEYIKPHGSEEISRNNDIDITNHGLGSGIYGFAEATEQLKSDALKDHGSTAYTIHMNKPLYLQDSAHGVQLTELSKSLQRVATRFRQERKSGDQISDWITTQPEMNSLKSKLVNVVQRAGGDIVADEAPEHVKAALKAFFTEYDSGKPFVRQPINFLLGRFGYDGIYATDSTNNAYNRGNVAYTVPAGTDKTAKADRLNL
jgi:hypothetical protein